MPSSKLTQFLKSMAVAVKSNLIVSLNTHKRLRNMTAGAGNASSSQYSQDCSICLNSIAVSFFFPSSGRSNIDIDPKST